MMTVAGCVKGEEISVGMQVISSYKEHAKEIFNEAYM